MNTLFVGIDVSTKHNQACAINFDQFTHFNKSFDNSPDGSQLLFDDVTHIIQVNHYDSVIFVAESTSVYDYHVCAFLVDKLSLLNINTLVYSVNAKAIKNYKKHILKPRKLTQGMPFIVQTSLVSVELNPLYLLKPINSLPLNV